jgi:excisionase family DNA binding protein
VAVRRSKQDRDADYVTVPEAAALLGVSSSTIWRWIANGNLPAYRVGPRFVRVRRTELSALIRPVRPSGVATPAKEQSVSDRPKPEQDDLWAGYDPEAVRQALREFAGTITKEEGEARIRALYEAREAGTRPTTRP